MNRGKKCIYFAVKGLIQHVIAWWINALFHPFIAHSSHSKSFIPSWTFFLWIFKLHFLLTFLFENSSHSKSIIPSWNVLCAFSNYISIKFLWAFFTCKIICSFMDCFRVYALLILFAKFLCILRIIDSFHVCFQITFFAKFWRTFFAFKTFCFIMDYFQVPFRIVYYIELLRAFFASKVLCSLVD